MNFEKPMEQKTTFIVSGTIESHWSAIVEARDRKEARKLGKKRAKNGDVYLGCVTDYDIENVSPTGPASKS